ncbi:MAG TPA: TolC family protein [Bacteroidales bacterium]
MKRVIIFWALAIISLSQALAQDSLVIKNLREAITLAFKENTDVVNSQLEIESKRQRNLEVLSDGLPQIKATGKVTDNLVLPKTIVPAERFGGTPGSLIAIEFGVPYNVEGGILARQTLFDKSFLIGLKAARSSVQLSELSSDKTREDVAMQVASVYYNILLCTKQIQYLRKQLESYHSLYHVAEIQLQAGVSKKSDMDRIQVNQTNLETALLNYENLYQQQMYDLKLLLGINTNAPLAINDSITEASLIADSTSFDIHNRADWQIIQKQGELQQLEIKQKRAGYMPVISLNAQYTEDYYGKELKPFDASWYNSSFLFVTLDIPIFDGFKKKAQVAQSNIAWKETQNRQMFLESTANKEIADAQNKLTYSISRLNSQVKNIDLASEVFQETTQEYKQGTSSMSDLLNAENSLLESQRQYLGALADMILAELSLQKAKGTLLPNLHVK